MQILYMDDSIIVCIKPPRVLSTDEPGGLPSLIRAELGDKNADIRTVHRLDMVVSGLMVLCRSAESASELSRQIREGEFQKEYLAVAKGATLRRGTMRDLMYRDRARRMSFVTDAPGKGVQEAILDYELLDFAEGLSLVRVILRTGRTHQIRCQFASRKLPLVGDRKYGSMDETCEIALWSHKLGFAHPVSGQAVEFSAKPEDGYPWSLFEF